MQGSVYFYAVGAVVIWSTLAATAKSLLTTIPAFGALFLSSLTAPRGRAEQRSSPSCSSWAGSCCRMCGGGVGRRGLLCIDHAPTNG